MEWAFFFDIDGTLAELAPSPSEVVVHDDIPGLITSLNALSGGAVALITGRAISDVDNMLTLDEVSVIGQHGYEVRTADGVMQSTRAPHGDIARVRDELERVVAGHPGLLIEFKGASVALHYRASPRLGGYVHRLMRSLAARYAPGFTVQTGKCVVELRPASTNKGVAIAKLMATNPFHGRVPVFIGDDVTDEHGFDVVNRMSGYSIKVGPGRTAAKWRISDVTGVRRWLQCGIDAFDTQSGTHDRKLANR